MWNETERMMKLHNSCYFQWQHVTGAELQLQ